MSSKRKKIVTPRKQCFIERIQQAALPYKLSRRTRNWPNDPPDYLDLFLDPEVAKIAYECATLHSE
jgi:hypothetical protein